MARSAKDHPKGSGFLKPKHLLLSVDCDYSPYLAEPDKNTN